VAKYAGKLKKSRCILLQRKGEIWRARPQQLPRASLQTGQQVEVFGGKRETGTRSEDRRLQTTQRDLLIGSDDSGGLTAQRKRHDQILTWSVISPHLLWSPTLTVGKPSQLPTGPAKSQRASAQCPPLYPNCLGGLQITWRQAFTQEYLTVIVIQRDSSTLAKDSKHFFFFFLKYIRPNIISMFGKIQHAFMKKTLNKMECLGGAVGWVPNSWFQLQLWSWGHEIKPQLGLHAQHRVYLGLSFPFPLPLTTISLK